MVGAAKRWVRTILKTAGFALAFLLISSIGLAMWLSSKKGSYWLATELSSRMDMPDFNVEIAGIEGSIFSPTTLKGVTVADKDGVFLKAPILHLKWLPYRLFFGEVHIESVLGKPVELDRIPARQAKQSEQVANLPFSLYLGMLDLPIYYASAEYSFVGNTIMATDDYVSGHVRISTPVPTEQIEATVKWSRRQKQLSFESKIEARSGRLLGDLMGLGTDDILIANASGSGDIKHWSGQFDAKVDDKLSARGSLAIDGARWRALFTQEQNGFVPHSLHALLGRSASGEVTLDVAEDTGPSALTAKVSAGDAQLDFDGSVSLGDQPSLNGGVLQLSIPEATIDNTLLGGIELTSTISTTDGKTGFDFQLAAKRAEMRKIAIETLLVNGSAEIIDRQITGIIDKAAFRLTSGQTALNIKAMQAIWGLSTDDQAWVANITSLESDSFNLESASLIGKDTRVGAAAARVQLIESALPLWSQGIVTSGDVMLDLELARNKAHFDITANAAGTALAYADSAVWPLVGPEPTLTVHASMDENGTVKVASANLLGTAMEMTISDAVIASNGQLNVPFRVEITNTEPFVQDAFIIPAQATFLGFVNGEITAPIITIGTELASASGYGIQLDDPNFELVLSRKDRTWGGELKVAGQTKLGEAHLATDFVRSGNQIFFNTLDIDLPFMKGQGTIVWSNENLFKGDFSLSLMPGKTSVYDVLGTGSAAVRINSTSEAFELDAEIAATDVSIATPNSFPILLAATNGTVTLNQRNDQDHLLVDMSVMGLSYGARKIDTLTIRKTSPENVPLALEAKGFWENSVNLSGTLVPDRRGAHLNFDLLYGDALFKSLSPVKISWQDGLNVNAESLSVVGGPASAYMHLSKDDTTARFSAKDVGLRVVNTVFRGQVQEGSFSAAGAYQKTANAEWAELGMQIQGLHMQGSEVFADTGSYGATFDAQLQDGALIISSEFQRSGNMVGTLKGKLPIHRPGGQTGFSIRGGEPINLSLWWQGEVAPLWLLARQPDHILTGHLEGNLSLSGDLDTPKFAGQIQLQNGRYEYDPIGFVASNIDLMAAGTQHRIELTALQASDGETGTLSGTGYFDLSPRLFFPGELKIETDSFKMTRLDQLTSIASASLTYSRQEGDSKLSGQINTQRVAAAIPKALPKSVINIDVVEINGPEQNDSAVAVSQNGQRWPTSLDLSVSVPGVFFVTGRGLESEWKGAVAIRGTSKTPKLSGTVDLKHGTFSLGNKIFSITEGKLIFKEGRRIDPDIFLSATYEAPTIKATIQITGPSSAPSINLSSVPGLPEDEIMARILFGRSVTELSPLQIVEVVTALNTLRGGSQLNVMGKLRRTIGLDTLTISAEENDFEATLITGGKYLTKNVYVEIETSVASSEIAPRLKVELTKNLLVESEVGPRQGSSLKLKWFWEY